MGGTTAMVGVGLLLAQEGKHVVLVNTDIEAPGLSSLFFPENAINRGTLDCFLENRIGAAGKISDYTLSYDVNTVVDQASGSLTVIPAGRVDENYLSKLARIDFQGYQPNSLSESLKSLLEDIDKAYPDTDYILLDARAGFHDLGGVTLGRIPHGDVLFGSHSDPSWSGIQQAVRYAGRVQGEEDEKMFLIMAASMSESRFSERYSGYLESFLRRSYEVFLECYYGSSPPSLMAQGDAHYPVTIDYHPALNQNLHFYPMPGVSEEVCRAQIALVMEKPYQELTERIQAQFQ